MNSIIYSCITKLCNKNVDLHLFTIINENTTFEGKNRIGKFSRVYDCYLGMGTYVAASSRLYKMKIGKFCSIGEEVKCITGTHPVGELISTHPCFYSPSTSFGNRFCKNDFKEYKEACLGYLYEVGNDVWIGSRVSILQGVKIGDGAIIAAGAVVTRDIEPYTIVGGVPAKVIKKRFNDEEIENLCKIKWWNFDELTLEKASGKMKNISTFIKEYSEGGK